MNLLHWYLRAASYWLHYAWHRINRKQSFRVRYKEGGLSRRMSYWTAVDYLKIFNGREILFDPEV